MSSHLFSVLLILNRVAGNLGSTQHRAQSHVHFGKGNWITQWKPLTHKGNMQTQESRCKANLLITKAEEEEEHRVIIYNITSNSARVTICIDRRWTFYLFAHSTCIKVYNRFISKYLISSDVSHTLC